jgi:hypothetical protein
MRALRLGEFEAARVHRVLATDIRLVLILADDGVERFCPQVVDDKIQVGEDDLGEVARIAGDHLRLSFGE